MTAAQLAVTALGAGAIGWELWYFVFSRRPGAAGTAAPRTPSRQGGRHAPPPDGRVGSPSSHRHHG